MVFKWTSWYFSTYHFWEVLASRLHRSLDRLQTPDSSTVPTKQNVVRHGEKVKLESDGQLWAKAKQTKRRAVNALIHSLTFATGCCPAVCPLLKHPNTSSRNKQVLLSSTEQRLDWREQAGWGSTAGCQPLRSSCCPSHSHTKRNIEKKSQPPAICFSLFFPLFPRREIKWD